MPCFCRFHMVLCRSCASSVPTVSLCCNDVAVEGLQEQTQGSGDVSSLEKGCQGKVWSHCWEVNTGKIRGGQWTFVQQAVRSETGVMWDLSLLDASGFCVGMLALLL